VWTPEDTDSAAALAKGRLHFRLDGEKLRGSWILTRTSRGDERASWLLIKRHDEEARQGIDITRERPESVKRAPKAARRASRAALPQFVTPQLATLVTRPPKTGDWVYEAKHDGYRMLARFSENQVRLFTRSGRDWTDKVYIAGRTRSWIKLKCRLTQDFVIAGYTRPGGSRHGFGALVLGVYERPGRLVYAGKVGTGFDEDLLRRLTRKFADYKKPDSALANPPRERDIQWLRPVLVAEVEFTERTDDGVIRQGSFLGLREDIPAKSVGMEKPQAAPESEPSRTIKITHPDRLIWPQLGIRKIDLVRYFEEIGERFVPHVANRPLTLVRCPDGVGKECFYQRHARATTSM
jgi:ATP-dependent DNA ligase